MNNKKIISIGLTGCLLLNCTAFAAAPAKIKKQSKPKAVVSSSVKKSSVEKTDAVVKKLKVQQDSKFSISLQQNASTGYSWSYKANTDTIKLVDQKTIDNNPKGLVGAPTKGVWTFKANSSGKYEIVFSYSRSWEKNKKAAKTIKYQITVSAADEMNSAKIPNPLINYSTIEDARKAVGFVFAVPSVMPDGYNRKDIIVIGGDLAEIFYSKDNNEILYRTAKGEADISGDYNTYDETNTVAVGDIKVTCKGSKGSMNLATWSVNGISFSLSFKAAVSEKELISIIENIK
jgi:predicted secreted protein